MSGEPIDSNTEALPEPFRILDGVPFTVPLEPDIFRLQCCDCDLVHDISFSIELDQLSADFVIHMTMTAKDEETEKLRSE